MRTPPPVGRRRPWVVALVAYTAVTVVLLAGSLRPGRTLVPADAIYGIAPYSRFPAAPKVHNPLPSDAALQFFPLFRYYAGELREGRLPQWNPRILAGTPMSPNGYFATHYPASLLARWLDPFDAYDAYVALHLVLGAIGCYALGRRLGAAPVAAWVAGLLALGATFWVHWSLHLGHLVGMVWLPLVLAAAHLVVVRPSPVAVAGLASAFGLWWLGGNPQFCYYGTLVLGAATAAFLVARLRRSGRRAAGFSVVALGVGLVLGALLAMPTLLPTAALSDDVVRDREPVSSTAGTHLRAPDLAEFLVPELGGSPIDRVVYRPERYGGLQLDSPFVGVTTLVLAVTAGAVALAGRRRRRAVLAVLALAAGVVVLAFTGPPHHLLHGLLPGYDRFRASSRWLAVLPALLVPAAAVGLTALLDGDRRARRVAVVAGGAALVGVALLIAVVQADAESPKGFLAPRLAVAALAAGACLAAAVAAGRQRTVALLLVAGAAMTEVAFQVPRWYPSLSKDATYPPVAALRIAGERGGRLLRIGPITNLPSIPPNIPMAYGVDEVQGQAVYFPKLVDRYLRAIDDYGTFSQTDNTAPSLRSGTLVAAPAVRVLDARTVVVDRDPPPPDLATLLDPGDPNVYGIPSAGPALVVADATPASEEAMWDAVADPRWDPARTAAVVGLDGPVRGSGGTVTAVRRRPADEIWRVDAGGGGLLRVSGAWHDGWKATVDGRPVEVLRADGLFRSVVVPPGSSMVRFRFVNDEELLGRRLAAGAMGVILALPLLGAAYARRTRGNRRPKRPVP